MKNAAKSYVGELRFLNSFELNGFLLGQKICAHIHGVLPYLFIEDQSIASCSDCSELQKNLRSFAKKIESVLSNRSSDSYEGKQFVYDIQPLKARQVRILSGEIR